MDLLSWGLVFGTGFALYEGLTIIATQVDRVFRTWRKLQDNNNLEGYKIKHKEAVRTGLRLTIDIPIGGSTKALSDNKEAIENAYKCKVIIRDIPFSNNAEIELITKEIKELDYKFIELSGTKLLIGYDYKGTPIIADMMEAPHLLLTGLSGQGKTGMLRVMIKNLVDNRKSDVVLLNGFIDDYRGFNLRHINNHENIKNFIQGLLDDIDNDNSRTRPLYVVFEELGKVKDKELINLTTKLLQYGRHNKIYLIGVIQTATKEELKFKTMFNARCTFKQLEESSYRVVLGCSVDDKLQKREFYLYTNDLYKGKTYKLDF